MADGYRKLLWAYPRDYRRERGDEMVSTFVDAGLTRPSWRAAFNLLRHGMRCRLGRPASRSIAVWATLFSVACGLCVGSMGARAGWETARPLPDQATAEALFTSVLREHEVGKEIQRSPAMFTTYGEPLDWDNVGTLLSFDGGEYGLGGLATSLLGPPPMDERDTIATALQRLHANGWRTSEPLTRNAGSCATAACDPSTLPTQTLLTARRGDDVLVIQTFSGAQSGATYLSVTLGRATPWAVYPGAAAGFVLGALAAWLMFGWVSRRTQHRPWQRSMSTVLFATIIFLIGAPILYVAPFMVEHHLSEPHFRWHPMWEWLGQPALSPIVLTGLLAALPALVLALLPLPRLAGSREAAVDQGL